MSIESVVAGGAIKTVETAAAGVVGGPLAAIRTFVSGSKGKIVIAIIAAAIAIGGFLVVQNHWLINKNVKTQVANHDQAATIQTYQTKSKVDDASAKIDQQFAQKHEQTQKEYVYVRQTIHDAPSQDRNAPASPVVIDTLNGLDRLHQHSESGVPNADVPAG